MKSKLQLGYWGADDFPPKAEKLLSLALRVWGMLVAFGVTPRIFDKNLRWGVMSEPTYGPKVKTWVKEFFKALLVFAKGELQSAKYLKIEVEYPQATQLVMKTRLDCLRQLAEKCGVQTSQGKITEENIRDGLKDYLRDFLNILDYDSGEDHTKGNLTLTLRLWSDWQGDINKNLVSFDALWKQKKAEKDQQKRRQNQSSSKLIQGQQMKIGLSPSPYFNINQTENYLNTFSKRQERICHLKAYLYQLYGNAYGNRVNLTKSELQDIIKEFSEVEELLNEIFINQSNQEDSQ